MQVWLVIITTIFLSGCLGSSQQQRATVTDSPREKSCAMVKASAYLAPTRSGSFGEGFANAEAAYANCMAGQPVSAPPQPRTLSCHPGYQGSMTCTEI